VILEPALVHADACQTEGGAKFGDQFLERVCLVTKPAAEFPRKSRSMPGPMHQFARGHMVEIRRASEACALRQETLVRALAIEAALTGFDDARARALQNLFGDINCFKFVISRRRRNTVNLFDVAHTE
jgi:hypothetical protein